MGWEISVARTLARSRRQVGIPGVCFYTPRISFEDPKTAVSRMSAPSVYWVHHELAGRWCAHPSVRRPVCHPPTSRLDPEFGFISTAPNSEQIWGQGPTGTP